MDTLDLGASTTTPHDDSRTAVLAAAELVRAWIHTQKAGWNDPSRPFVDLTAPSTASAIPIPALADHAGVTDFQFTPAVPDAESSHDAVFGAQAPAGSRVALPAFPSGLLSWLGRAAVAAAVVAAVVGAGWALRAYWPSIKLRADVGTATIESDPPGATVAVDGKPIGTTPLSSRLPVGAHVVEFSRDGVKRTIPIDVVKDKSISARVEWAVRHVGRLDVQSDPKGAKVLLDGKDRGVTPLTIDDILVGPHTVILQSAGGNLQRSVTIAEDKTFELKESIFSGWVHISTPIELQIMDGKAAVRLDDRNQALIKPGTHELRFSNKALGFADTRKIDVKPGETTSVSIVPPPSKLTVTASEPSEVLVDGDRAGDTPLTEFPVAIGTRDITVKSANDVRRKTLTITTQPAVLEIDFSKP